MTRELPAEIIRRKRRGEALPREMMQDFFSRYLNGEIADYQVTAMLMAMTLKGMERDEIVALTEIMRNSGTTLHWPRSGGPIVDKHSTGGVGDKTSLVILPLCVCEGLRVPMMSGRGLGHTGGTLDKLESIPGMRTRISESEASTILAAHGGVFMGQSDTIAPLDKRLYALRDVTATAESLPLIAASILSKKLAEGLDALVMDVKAGSGAFLPTTDEARTLAQTLVDVGAGLGLPTTAWLTSMASPLGSAAGNALEVAECIAILKGERSPGFERTRALSLRLTTTMVMQGMSLAPTTEAAVVSRLEDHLASGRAFAAFARIVAAQGGKTDVLDDPRRLERAPVQVPVFADGGARGYIEAIDVRALGLAIVELGGGRKVTSDAIDAAVGFAHLKAVGDGLTAGEPLAIVHARTDAAATIAHRAVQKAYRVGPRRVDDPLILERIG